MKKIYKIALILLVLSGVFLIYLNIDFIFDYFNLDIQTILVDLVIINIIVYLLRTVLIRVINYFFGGKFIQYIIAIIINIIWLVFIFILLYSIPGFVGVATILISFLIAAFALTFRGRINNMVSGMLILASGAFEVGDLMKVRGTEGIVAEISLNYTKIQGFDGLYRLIPNTNIYNAAVKKFSHSKSNKIPIEEKRGEGEEKTFLKKYTTKISEIISKEEKITRYIKIVQILPLMDPEEIESCLSKIFDRYEKVFGYKPFYYINYTTFDRCSITLQIVTEKPRLVPYYINSFLRDLLYNLYENDIYYGWEKEKTIVPRIDEEDDV